MKLDLGIKEQFLDIKKAISDMKGYKKDDWIAWLKRSYTGLIAAVLIIILFIMLFVGSAGSADLNNPDAGNNLLYQVSGLTAKGGANGDYQVNANGDINSLVKNFFKYYAEGNIEQLKTIITPLDDNQAKLVSDLSQYIEGYYNIGVYSKAIPNKDAYLVSVYHETKFKDINTKAPGLTIFYIHKNDQGKYYIDNSSDSMVEEEVATFITNFRTEEDVIELSTRVNELSTKALQDDEKLYDFVVNTYQKIYTEYYTAVQAAADAKAAEEAAAAQAAAEAAKAEADKKAAEEAAAAAAAEHTFTNGSTVYANDMVYIRKEASTDSDIVGMTMTGDAFTVVEAGSEWTKVQTSDNFIGFIKNEFIQNSKPE